MSLLMQALKKAERARQNGLPEEPAAPDDWGLEPRADGPAPGLPDAAVSAPAVEPAPRPSPGLAELSLEPLQPSEPSGNAAVPASGPRREPLPEAGQELRLEPALEPAPPPPAPAAAPLRTRGHIEPTIPLEPATEAVHDPVPPQARHEPARNRAPAGPGRTGATPPEARPKAPMAGAARPEAAAARAGAAARARAAAAETPGMDMARMRVAGLSGIALVILATFGYVYWRATTAPGPGAALPMVPMPPPSATGATGIAVPPAGPPFGSGTPIAPATAGSDMAGATAPPAGEMPAGGAPFTAPSSMPAVPGVPAQAATAPPAEAPPQQQRYMTDDPALQRAGQPDEAERMMREERARAAAGGFAPPDAAGGGNGNGAAPRPPPAYAPPSGGTAGGEVHIARGSSPAIAPAVSAAYAAFVAGDYATARREYDNALRQDPNNRDALLGSAAVAQRESRGVAAAAAYARLLELDPADPDALAALVALRPGDLARSEAQLRNVLKSRPDAAPVLFALGNLYARQNRWPEAQQAYFRAYTAAPGNADYAFNLAVGLDRLNQGKLAVTYYQQALAATGPAGFDRAAVQRRVRELRDAAAPAPSPSTSSAVAAPAAAWPDRGN